MGCVLCCCIGESHYSTLRAPCPKARAEAIQGNSTFIAKAQTSPCLHKVPSVSW